VGLNHRPADYESAALPLSYAGSKSRKERNRARYTELENTWGKLSLCSFIPLVTWYRQLVKSSLLPRILKTATDAKEPKRKHCSLTLSIDKAASIP
jgi:hypothetical protein